MSGKLGFAFCGSTTKVTPRTMNSNGEFGRRDQGKGWKVFFIDSNEQGRFWIPMVFASERDASIACRAVKETLGDNCHLNEFQSRIRAYGLAAFRRLLVRDLRW